MHDAFNKLPPQDLNAERAVLGSVMLFGDCLDEVAGIIRADDFYLDAHHQIFVVMRWLGESGGKIDALTVSVELDRQNKLEEIGGNQYLKTVLESVPHAAHVAYYAGLVREKSLLRKAIYAAGEVLRNAYDSNAVASEVITGWAGEAYGLLETQTSRAEHINTYGLQAMDCLGSPKPIGFSLGYDELYEMTNGAKPGEVTVLGALSGVGKSALACNFVRRVASEMGVLFCSIEMTGEELHDRMLASDLGVSISELRPMARNDFSRAAVADGINAFSGLNIVIDASEDQTIQSIAAQARLTHRKMPLGLIVVDYLQIVTPSDLREPRERQVAGISRGLSRLAKRMHVHVLALAQLNNEGSKRVDKKPRLSDLRESAAIVQNANVVLLLDQPAQWDPDKYEAHEAHLYVAKNRGGPKGRIDLRWDGRSVTFRDHVVATPFDGTEVDFGP